jgi:pimeloyl-ACP methyl ester carboxylesterase
MASSVQLSAQPARTAEDVGRKALDLLLSGQYSELSGMFSEKFSQTVTVDFLQQRVSAELKEFGQAQNIGPAVLGADGVNQMVSFPVRFSNTSIHVQFTLDQSNRVVGMYFRPPDKPLPDAWKRPSYSKPETFHERELTIGNDMWKLGGTLTSPASNERVPGVLLVHGPGPDDRDESLFANRIFRDLAEGLASRGYAALRYDKRTKVYAEQLSETGYTIEEETVDDATRAMALLRKQPEIDPARVYLLGHSLGGYAGPLIAARDGKLAGLILMAAPARPIEDVAFDQTDYVAHLRGEPSSTEQARLNQLRAEVDRVKSLDPKADNPPVLLGLPVAWWLNLKGYSPVTEAQRLGIPTLVIQGERDFQVTMKDFSQWKSGLVANRNVTFHSYPSLNNLFIKGEGKGSPADYHLPGNVAPEVLDDIVTWLSTQNH